MFQRKERFVMADFGNSDQIRTALRLVGELLEAQGHGYYIVVIGGAAMNLLGLRTRATTDVDVIAQAIPDARGVPRLRRPDQPLPGPLLAAAATVAGDLGLDPDWLNAGPAGQWETGLPPGMEGRVEWEAYGGLRVGLADRRDLVFLKLYAAADQTGSNSVHFQDLVALSPSDEELDAAAVWIRRQDAGPEFNEIVAKVINHVRTHPGRTR